MKKKKKYKPYLPYYELSPLPKVKKELCPECGKSFTKPHAHYYPNPTRRKGKVEKKPMVEIVFQVLDPIIRKCACRELLSNAIKHTRIFCYDEVRAVRIELLPDTKEKK